MPSFFFRDEIHASFFITFGDTELRLNMNNNELYELYKKYPNISTDTRNIGIDSIFFALKGDRFNANQFADLALDKGAKAVVIDEEDYARDDRYIVVKNVLESLQELAKLHRSHLHIPVIGITGTNGKTTTKELLNSVLSTRYTTFATAGNLNNHIGVPLTLLSIGEAVEVAVIEMGANHPGEIDFLCHIAQPTYGLITNVGKAHLEGFGSFEGVKNTKAELYRYVSKQGGTLFLQSDNEHLLEMMGELSVKEVITYGLVPEKDVTGTLISADPMLSIGWHKKGGGGRQYIVNTHLTGTYNVENILASIAVGVHFGLTSDQINEGVSNYKPRNNRSQVIQTVANRIIADYYNANPSSMLAALENLFHLQAAHKVAVLGDMFEMGEEAESEHKLVLDQALSLDLNRVIFVGEMFFGLRDERAEFYKTIDDAKKALSNFQIKGSTVLLKASRGMAFENLIELL